MLDLGNQSFETFSLEWYSQAEDPALGVSPRENMDWIYRTCKRYAAAFGPGSGNLLLTGDPGLGKTFLSAAIAREASEEGFSVVYDTAAHIFDRFEARKFSRDDDAAGEDVRRYLNCELLILDDLGSEFSSPFIQAALYEVVNTRLAQGQRTVISSNLNMPAIRQRYTPQLASRLEGEYLFLPFFGQDIRLLKNGQR